MRHRPARHRWPAAVAGLLLAGVVVAPGLALADTTIPDPLARATAVRLSGSVLRIEAARSRGGFALGSGVMVGPDLVVTNCHVTRDSAQVSVVRGGVRWRASAQLADVTHDLCLLQVPGVVAPVVPLAEADVLIGQPVTALGYSGGVDLQHSFGEVVDLHRLGDGSVLQTSNGFSSGASGGGLFDRDGRLVGVLTFHLRGGGQHYFAAPAQWVRQLVVQAGSAGLPPVQPLDPALLPYWQQQGAQQPRFLRASVLLREQRWGDLAGLARGWLQDDALDGEPWYLLGLALQQLDQPGAARAAMDCALRLQPQRQAALAPPAPAAVPTPEPAAEPATEPATTRVAASVACPGAA